MKDLISIIVPIYNTNKTLLQQCIISLVNQTYENIEIILVDDGSEKEIANECDKYQEQFQKIRVIHKQNGGLSSARNAGQKEANGKWIMFVDADDWLDVEICEKLISASEVSTDIDIYIFGFVQHFKEKRKDSIYQFKNGQILSNENNFLIKEALKFPSLFSSSCWKMYNYDFLCRNQLMHNEEIRQGSEDLEFMIRTLAKVRHVLMVKEFAYHYIMNPDSITNSFNESNAYLVQKCFIEIENFLLPFNDYEVKKMYYIRSWYALCASIISGFLNYNNGLSYRVKITKLKKFLDTSYAKRVIRNIDKRDISFSRRCVYELVVKKIYFPICLIAFVRGIQKRRH